MEVYGVLAGEEIMRLVESNELDKATGNKQTGKLTSKTNLKQM